MKGTIKSLFNRGFGSYGFIIDETGVERYFAMEDLKGSRFNDLRKGLEVTFTPTTGGRRNQGQRATDVSIA